MAWTSSHPWFGEGLPHGWKWICLSCFFVGIAFGSIIPRSIHPKLLGHKKMSSYEEVNQRSRVLTGSKSQRQLKYSNWSPMPTQDWLPQSWAAPYPVSLSLLPNYVLGLLRKLFVCEKIGSYGVRSLLCFLQFQDAWATGFLTRFPSFTSPSVFHANRLLQRDYCHFSNWWNANLVERAFFAGQVALDVEFQAYYPEEQDGESDGDEG